MVLDKGERAQRLSLLVMYVIFRAISLKGQKWRFTSSIVLRMVYGIKHRM